MNKSKLFEKLEIRGVTLKNRVVVSPMWQYAGNRGNPTDWHLMHLGRFAHGGAGLVIQEGTAVDIAGRGTHLDLGLWDDKFISGLSRLVAMIESGGATPGIQLMHAGRKARQKPPELGRGPLQYSEHIPDWDDWDIVAPSAIAESSLFPTPREMTVSDISSVVEKFVQGARRADQAGYQVIDLHAAHGYLIHEFLSPLTNFRGDQYGGSWENRVRFLIEIVDGIRKTISSEKALFVRLSCIDGPSDGWSMQDSIRLARLLKEKGVDLIDCTSGGIAGSPLPPGEKATYSYQVRYASDIRREADILTSAVGLIIHARQAEEILREKHADLVMLGREFIYNPNWPIDASIKLNETQGFDVAGRSHTSFVLKGRFEKTEGIVPSTVPATEFTLS